MTQTKRVKIIERSIISGKNIFIKNLYQMFVIYIDIVVIICYLNYVIIFNIIT